MSAPMSVVCRERFPLGNEDVSSNDSSKKRARSSSRTRNTDQNQFNDVDPFKMNNIKQLINDVAEKIEKSRHASSSHTSEAAMSFGSPSSHTSTKSTTSGQVDFGFGVDTSGDAFTFDQRPVYKELAELLATSPRARSASPSPEPLQKKRSRTQKRADALRRQKARQQAEKQATQAEAGNQAVAAPVAEKRSKTQKRANTKRRQKIREQGERQAKQAEAAKEAEKLRQAKKLQKKLNAIANNSIPLPPPPPPPSPMLMQLDAQMDEDVEAWSVRLQNELIEAKTEMLSMKRTNDFLMAQVQHLQAKVDGLTEANQAALREMQAVRTAAARFVDSGPEITMKDIEDMERRILNGITAEVPSSPL